MKNLSTAMTEIVKGNSARYYSKYVVDEKEHTETLNNFKFQNMINPNNEITIGNTCASSVTFSIYMPTINLENKEITIFEGVKIDTEIKSYELYMDKYENVRMNMLVNSGDITYNDTVKIN